MTTITIYKDSREKNPFTFPSSYRGHKIKIVRKELKTGDYLPHGYSSPRGGIVVERKGFSDFLSCLSGPGLKRFREQLNRLKKWTFPVVVIEGNIMLCKVGYYSTLNWEPISVIRMVARLTTLYGVPLIFMEDHEYAARFSLDFIIESIDLIHNGKLT